jgi:hypothetical protein
MKKTYIAKLNGREVAFDGSKRTYTHAAVKFNKAGFLEVVARYGRPGLVKAHDTATVVPVELGELSKEGQIDALWQRIDKLNWRINWAQGLLEQVKAGTAIPSNETYANAEIATATAQKDKLKTQIEKLKAK